MKNISRKLWYILLMVVVISGMMLITTGSLYAGGSDTGGGSPSGTSGSIFLNEPNTLHANKSYTDFLEESDVVLEPGQVLWHLVMTGIADGGTATIDGVSGERHGKELQWTFINNLTISPDWEAIVTDGITDKIDLKVSNTCYGGLATFSTTGSIIINKEITGNVNVTGKFIFDVFDVATEGTPIANDVQIDIVDNASNSTQVDNLIIDKDYWVEEVDGPGWPTCNVTPGLNTANRLGPIKARATTQLLESVTFINDPVVTITSQTGTIVLTKEGLTGDLIAVFALHEGTTDGPIVSPKENGTGEVGAAPNNILTWEGLDLTASYYLIELIIPAGWTGSTINNPLVFENGNTILVTVVNSPPTGDGGTTTTTTVTVAAITEEAITEDEGTIEVAALTEPAEVIEVAALEELPRTGNNMLFYVIGFALIAVGAAFGSFFIPKALRKREN